MSAAIQNVVSQLNARRLREGEYRARCPVHQGKSNTSLSIKDAGDRVLIHCHAGCTFEDILAALGMKSARELFDSVKSAPALVLTTSADALDGLRLWREDTLIRTAAELRRRDAAILKVDSDLQGGRISESQAWELLAPLYRGYSDLEERFEILCTGSDMDALEVYRWMKQNNRL